MSVNGNVVNAAEVLKGVETRLFINNEVRCLTDIHFGHPYLPGSYQHLYN